MFWESMALESHSPVVLAKQSDGVEIINVFNPFLALPGILVSVPIT